VDVDDSWGLRAGIDPVLITSPSSFVTVLSIAGSCGATALQWEQGRFREPPAC